MKISQFFHPKMTDFDLSLESPFIVTGLRGGGGFFFFLLKTGPAMAGELDPVLWPWLLREGERETERERERGGGGGRSAMHDYIDNMQELAYHFAVVRTMSFCMVKAPLTRYFKPRANKQSQASRVGVVQTSEQLPWHVSSADCRCQSPGQGRTEFCRDWTSFACFGDPGRRIEKYGTKWPFVRPPTLTPVHWEGSCRYTTRKCLLAYRIIMVKLLKSPKLGRQRV